ncbi:none [Acinetobacter populi]|uniref:none n=1 Tax=Acinetobacter populi TaxID=1582270 RepID=UPI001BC8771E|nr:none [Acinetobacter populi]
MSNQKIIEDADQTELEALFNSSSPIDAGITDDKQASALDTLDLIALDSSDWAAKDAELDNLSSNLSTEINYRFQLLQHAYPFDINGSNIKLRFENTNLFYIFCLIISKSKLKAKKGETAHNQKMARLFEKITLKIIQKSLGEFAYSHHFGFPREDGLGIIDAMNQLQSQLDLKNEMNVSLLPYNIQDLNKQKDLGIDQIIWIKRPDSRKHSHLFLLGQCACGQDYVQKYHDIDLKKIESYFRPFTYVQPVKVMSVPFILSDNEINRVSSSAGWLFDRVSLSSLYIKFNDIREEFNNQIIELISNSIPHGEKFKASYFFETLQHGTGNQTPQQIPISSPIVKT